jgi:predicted AlkP superfamily pyrophosphatase or phosphodiesterase
MQGVTDCCSARCGHQHPQIRRLPNPVAFLVLLSLWLAPAVVRPAAQQPPRAAVKGGPPQLLVLLIVDQMRGDYVDKFQRQWSQGLKRLVTSGAWFRQTNYPYYNTVTCAGHASIGTGSVPAVHGMILNGWWDRASRRQVACTDDDTAKTVSYGKPIMTEGESAGRLRTSTLADELRAQLDAPPRIAAFSLKARSAVTLGGHRPDAVAWFDDEGAWVTSTAFSKGPVAEVADYIARNPVENDFGKVWDRALPKDAYLYEEAAVGVRVGKGMTPTFPHIVKGGQATPDKAYYDQWQSSPFADEYLARMALSVYQSITAKDKVAGPGRRSVPNLLAISFSSLDKVGHDYGPNSHEVQDILVRLDRTIGELLSGLDRQVGAGNYVVALSADHGVPPTPERSLAMGIDSGRMASSAIGARAERFLAKLVGEGKHVLASMHDYLYFDQPTVDYLRAHPDARKALLDDLRELPGVMKAYWRDDLEANHFDGDPMGRRAALSFEPERSGDVMIAFKPYWMATAGTTSHGSGYAYDTHVPLILMGKGIVAGEYAQPASPTDIAPTLAYLAGITLPAATGRVLAEALERPTHP